MAKIIAKNLVKQFGEKRAVDDVSFVVEEGEFLAFVGPSGCGKTTTLRLLSGLESVSSGQIFFGDRDVTHIRPKDRNIGMVFQDYAVFPHLTVYENIAYGLISRRLPHSQPVTEAAKIFRIDHLLKRKPRQLSGGERQRVALARAIAREANLYLFDEPLSNLDAQLRHSAREDILNMHQRLGMPTVYVTHDQSEAMSMGDRIAVMRDGRLEQIGSGTELYEQPRNLFVAFFIGTPSINLFEATLKADGTDIWAEGDALNILLPDEIGDKVKGHVGQAVKIGIRPSDLHVPKKAPFPVSEDNTMQGIITVIEPSSTGSAVYLTTTDESEQDFIATFKLRLPASYLGREIPLAVNVERMQLFDAKTEESLLYN